MILNFLNALTLSHLAQLQKLSLAHILAIHNITNIAVNCTNTFSRLDLIKTVVN